MSTANELEKKVDRSRKFDKAGSEQPKERNRKVYAHEMTSAERFAVHSLQKTRNAITACREHIQGGKGCTAELVTHAIALQAACAELLFGK